MMRSVVVVLLICAACLIGAGSALAHGRSGPACHGPTLPPGVSSTTCGDAAIVTERPAGILKKIISIPTKILSVPKKIVTTVVGKAVGTGTKAVATVGLTVIAAFVAAGDVAALKETERLVGASTSPELLSPWFSSAYWRVAGVSALLTLPFLFAAAIQALVRSDMALLARAAFGYLPLGMLAVGIAAPLTMLLLSASDEMSTLVSSASGQASTTFLDHASALAAGLSAAAGSPFLALTIGAFTVLGAIVLWLELMVRAAAVYVIVLMLPLFFAALVWPARRVWAIRSVELLVALVLSKFAIVAVLALGGSALDHASGSGPTTFLAGLALVLMAALAPWAMLRLLPLHEVASAAAGGLRNASVQPLTSTVHNARDLAGLADSHREALAQRVQEHRAQGDRDPAGSDIPRLPPGQAEAAAANIGEPAANIGDAVASAAGPVTNIGEPTANGEPAVTGNEARSTTADAQRRTRWQGLREPWREVSLDGSMKPVFDSGPPSSPGPVAATDAPPPTEVDPPPAIPDPPPLPRDPDGELP
jgi:hypothetical protein